MESYEKKYKNALEWARQVINGETGFIRKEVEEVFPELAESEDEKIRKSIIENLKGNMYRADGDYDLLNKQIAWLEKQQSVEEIVARCKDSWYNEGKIAGMAEGLSDDEKYQQGWHDALKKQDEQNHALNNGYSNGYIQAVEKACEWLYQRQAVDLEVSDIDKFVKEFKKEMED